MGHTFNLYNCYYMRVTAQVNNSIKTTVRALNDSLSYTILQ